MTTLPTTISPLVWITGASSGLGREVALQMARSGWRVAVSARNAEALQKLAQEVPNIFVYPADITDAEAIKNTVASIEATHGAIMVAVLNAGTYLPDDATTLDAQVFANTINTNLNGTVHCVAALLPFMLKRGAGQIALVSSVAGYRGLPRSLAYGASKAALNNFAEALWFDVAAKGIKVQLICPGFVRTPLTDKNTFPMPALMEVDAAASRLIAGLGSDKFEITFPRRFTYVLKALSLLPASLYLPLVRWATMRAGL